jgi:hypothetical protein
VEQNALFALVPPLLVAAWQAVDAEQKALLMVSRAETQRRREKKTKKVFSASLRLCAKKKFR